jgi:carbamoyl-phosphate synthase large subunit
VFVSVADRDKRIGLQAARRFHELGFAIAATSGTAAHLEANGVPVATVVAKLGEATGVDAVDLIASGKVDLVINSPRGRGARADGDHIRSAASVHAIPCLTTAAAGLAAAEGMADWAHHELRVRTLQEYHAAPTDQLELPL